METLIYPTLDLFLYDLHESFGQNEISHENKRKAFKRKLPDEIANQIDQFDIMNDTELTELLGKKQVETFNNSHYEGYYYPVRLRDSYGLLLDCSSKESQTTENLQWLAKLKQTLGQKLQGEKATLGQTCFFYASVLNAELEEYEHIAQSCYQTLIENANWNENKIGESTFSGGKLFELNHSLEQHIVIVLFSDEEMAKNTMPQLIQDALQLFWYHHKITWAYAQSQELKKYLKKEAIEIQACRAAYHHNENLLGILNKAHDVFTRYVDLLVGLESQGHTIETNLYNYRKRLIKINHQIANFNYPIEFELQAKEKYLHQIKTDHTNFNSQLKLIENLVTSIHVREIHKNVNHIDDVQTKIEWLEVFFMSFYATEFVHIMVILHKEGSNFFEIGLLAALFGGSATLIVLHFWKHIKNAKRRWILIITGILAGISAIALILKLFTIISH